MARTNRQFSENRVEKSSPSRPFDTDNYITTCFVCQFFYLGKITQNSLSQQTIFCHISHPCGVTVQTDFKRGFVEEIHAEHSSADTRYKDTRYTAVISVFVTILPIFKFGFIELFVVRLPRVLKEGAGGEAPA